MNVLKKILEEIDKKADYYETDEQGRENVRMVDMVNVEEIIRSHMGEVRDMHGKRLIDADLLMRKCEEWLKPKAPDEDEIVSLADIAVSMIMEIEEQPTVYVNDGWIPVEERLPEEKTEVLCCFENGTVQSLWQNWKNYGLGDYLDDDLMPTKIIAWRPLPEPYRPKEKDDEWK